MGRRDHALTSRLKRVQKTIWRIAVYIRLSKEDGNDVSYSVINQKEIIHSHIEKLPEDDEYIIVDYYIDDGLTGTDDSRKDFQRLLGDIEERKINCVIVKDLSRAFRNYADQGYYLDYYFQLHKVRFISIHVPTLDSFLQPDAMESIAVPIQGVVNDNHCRETSMKVRYVFDMKRSKGQFIGAFPPYGYRKAPDDKNSFLVDEEAAQVVRDIFAMFVHQGMTKMGIAKKLSVDGIPNPALYKRLQGMKYQNPHDRFENTLWCGTTIAKMLKNPVYRGHMVQGRQKVISYKVHNRMALPEDEWYVVEDTHDPIIDEETFEAAQRMLQRDTRRAPEQKELYLFSGFLRCADCQRAMVRKKEGNYVYHICSSYKNHANLRCTRHAIREEFLEKAVLETIQAQIGLACSLSDMIAEINSSTVIRTESKRLEGLLKARIKDREKVERLKDSLYENWQAGDLSREDYRRLKSRYEEQFAQINQAIKSLEEEQRVARVGVDTTNPYLRAFIKHQGITELNRGILTALVENIHIHEGNSITICFRYEDQYKRILEFIENNQDALDKKQDKAASF
jgi:site-specific DNA recombinase